MSHKGSEDKKKEGFPFTARQKRRLAGSRKTRKVDRNPDWRKKERLKRGKTR